MNYMWKGRWYLYQKKLRTEGKEENAFSKAFRLYPSGQICHVIVVDHVTALCPEQALQSISLVQLKKKKSMKK